MTDRRTETVERERQIGRDGEIVSNRQTYRDWGKRKTDRQTDRDSETVIDKPTHVYRGKEREKQIDRE